MQTGLEMTVPACKSQAKGLHVGFHAVVRGHCHRFWHQEDKAGFFKAKLILFSILAFCAFALKVKQLKQVDI